MVVLPTPASAAARSIESNCSGPASLLTASARTASMLARAGPVAGDRRAIPYGQRLRSAERVPPADHRFHAQSRSVIRRSETRSFWVHCTLSPRLYEAGPGARHFEAGTPRSNGRLRRRRPIRSQGGCARRREAPGVSAASLGADLDNDRPACSGASWPGSCLHGYLDRVFDTGDKRVFTFIGLKPKCACFLHAARDVIFRGRQPQDRNGREVFRSDMRD